MFSETNPEINVRVRTDNEAVFQRISDHLKSTESQAAQTSKRVADSLGGITTATDSWTSSILKNAAAYATGMIGVEAMGEAVRKATDFVADSVKVFEESERAQKKLETALTAQGRATGSVIGYYKDLGAQYQKTTVYDDDLIASMEALLVQIGDVSPKQMDKALRASTNLASGLGIDLESATKLVGKAFAGETGTLSRFGIVIDQTKLKTEGITAVLDAIEGKFGGQAAAEADTFAGAVKQVGNAWYNVKEAIGGVLAKDDDIKSFLHSTTSELQRFADNSETYGIKAATYLSGAFSWMKNIGGLAPASAVLDAFLLKDAKRMAEQHEQEQAAFVGPQLPDDWAERQKKHEEAQRKALESLKKFHADIENEFNSASGHKAIDAYKVEAAVLDELRQKHVEPSVDVLEDFRKKANAAADAFDHWGLSAQAAEARSRSFAASVDKAMLGVNLTTKYDLNDRASFLRPMLPGTLANEADLDALYAPHASSGPFGWANENPITALAFMPTIPKASGPPTAPSAWSNWGGDKGVLSQLGPSVIQAITGGGSVTGALGSVLGQGFGETMKTELEKNITGKIGNLLGSFLPGVGTILGSLGGSVISKIGGWLGIGKSQGKIEGEKADAGIADLQKSLLSTYGSLDAIDKIGKQVGIDLKGAWGDKNVAGLAHFQGMVDQLNKQLERNKQLQSDLGNIQNGDLIPDSVMQSIAQGNLTDESRTAIGNMLKSQTAFGVSSLDKIMSGFGASGLMDAHAALNKAKEGGNAREIADAQKALDDYIKQHPMSAAGAKGIGGGIAGLAASLSEQGASQVDIAAQLGPAVQAMQQQFADAGISGGAAFDKIAQSVNYLNDDAVKPLMQGISGVGDLMTVLSNTGKLDQETFKGLGDSILDGYKSLEKMGKGGPQALEAMQPQLQRVWELEKKNNLTLDEGTQALIDQAEKSGLVGESFKSPSDKMQDAIQRVIDKITILVDTLTKTLPEKAGQVKMPEISIPYKYRRDGEDPGDIDGQGGPVPQHAEGAYIRETHYAKVHAGEIIGPEDFMYRVMSRVLDAQPQRNGGGEPIVIQLTLDGKVAAESVYRHLPGVLQSKGVRM